MDSNTIRIITLVLGAYSIFILVCGTLFNALILCVCLRKKMRKVNAFKFFAVISIVDTVALYEWNLSHFTNAYFHVLFSYINLTWCRLGTFMQYVSLQYSAWMLVSRNKQLSNIGI